MGISGYRDVDLRLNTAVMVVEQVNYLVLRLLFPHVHKGYVWVEDQHDIMHLKGAIF